MISINKNLALNTDVDYPTDAQRLWLTYLPEVLQEKLDPIVVSELGWTARRDFNKITCKSDRRMWGAHGLGIVGNLTAVRFLEANGIDWKLELLGQSKQERKAA